MTEPLAPAVDPLEPWPDAVEWRAVSPKLITVELIGLSVWTAVLLAGPVVAGARTTAVTAHHRSNRTPPQ